MARAFWLSVAIPVFNALLDAVVVVITLRCVCLSPFAKLFLHISPQGFTGR
jgi:hypothetical protein